MTTETRMICDGCGEEIAADEPRLAVTVTEFSGAMPTTTDVTPASMTMPQTFDFHPEHLPESLKTE